MEYPKDHWGTGGTEGVPRDRGTRGIGDTKACNTKHYQYRYYRYIRVIPLNTPTPIPEIPTPCTGKFPCIPLVPGIGVHTPLHPGTIGRYHPGDTGYYRYCWYPGVWVY